MMNAFCRVTVISMAVEAIAIQPSSAMNNLLMRDFSCLLFCPFIMSTGLYLAMAIDDAVPEGIAINNAVKINMIYSPEVRIGCTSVSSRLLNISLQEIAARMAIIMETAIMNSASKVHLITTPCLSVPRSWRVAISFILKCEYATVSSM